MKKGDLIRATRRRSILGVVLEVNQSVMELGHRYTVDIMWSTGDIETYIDPRFLRQCNEAG